MYAPLQDSSRWIRAFASALPLLFALAVVAASAADRSEPAAAEWPSATFSLSGEGTHPPPQLVPRYATTLCRTHRPEYPLISADDLVDDDYLLLATPPIRLPNAYSYSVAPPRSIMTTLIIAPPVPPPRPACLNVIATL